MHNSELRTTFMSDVSSDYKDATITVRKVTRKDKSLDLQVYLSEASRTDAGFRCEESKSEFSLTLRAKVTTSDDGRLGISFWRSDLLQALFLLHKKWGPNASLKFLTNNDATEAEFAAII